MTTATRKPIRFTVGQKWTYVNDEGGFRASISLKEAGGRRKQIWAWNAYKSGALLGSGNTGSRGSAREAAEKVLLDAGAKPDTPKKRFYFWGVE